MDGGEVADDELGRLVGDVQVDTVQAAPLHLVVDGPGDDVPGRQLGALVMLGHEAAAVGQAQHGPLAPHGLGDQEGLGLGVIEAGGVELDELHVRHPATGAIGHGDAVARGGVWVGGVQKDLAGAASGQDGMAGGDGLHPVGSDVEDVGTVDPLLLQAELGAGDEVDRDLAFPQLDVGRLAQPGPHRVLHGLAGGVGDVEDAALAVTALPGQVVAMPVAVEGDAPADQPLDGGRTVLDDMAHGLRVAQTGTCLQGVPEMGVDAVLVAVDGSDAALGPVAGTVAEALLGDHDHLQVLGQGEGQGAGGQSGADDKDIAGLHGGRVQGHGGHLPP